MKKTTWIILIVVAVLIAFRIALPFIIENRINKKIETIPEYTGGIKDVDLQLFRGAFQIDTLVLDKIEDNNEVPFLSVTKVDISVEWSALLKGAFVGEVVVTEPNLNFVAPNNDEGEFGTEVDWVSVMKRMNPFTINRFVVKNGTIRYLDYASSPQVDLPLYNLNLEVNNITNTDNLDKALPTHIELTGISIGDGSLSFIADANLMKKIPDLDASLEFENVNLPDLNNFLEAYAKVDAENGVFNLYSEIAVNDAQLEGYVRPILDRVKILSLENEDGNVFEVVWEGIVGVVSELFENQPENQFATEVPLEGNIENVETGVLPAIWNIFRNAFIEAFEKGAGGEIKFSKVGDGENEEE